MNKLFTMLSARPHHSTQDYITPKLSQFNQFSDDFEYSSIPLENQNQSSQQIQLQDNSELIQLDSIQVAVPQIQQQQTGPINEKIKTVRIRLIEEKVKVDKTKLLFGKGNQTFKAEVKAKDERFKQVAKTIYIFYTAEDLLQQISSCPYFRGFKALDFAHIKHCLFPESEDRPDLKAIAARKKSAIQTLKYYVTQTDEGEYHGQMNKNKAPEGPSILYYKNGNIYIGEMKNRFRNGQGTMKYPDGSIYQGGWAFDAQEGQGQEIDTKGERFQGTFKNNARNGKGTLQWNNGYILEATWVNGYQEGNSTLHVKSQQISIQWVRGQIVKINSTPVADINENNLARQLPNLIHIKVNRDNKVSVKQEVTTSQTARF